MNYKKLIEGEKTEMPISSQVTLNDKNWKILKKFRFVEGDKYKYTFLAECIHCGFQKEVSNSGIYKGNIKCPNCFCQSEIGKKYGSYEITNFVGYTDGMERLYSVKCLKCGHEFPKKRINDIKKHSKDTCRYCDSIGDNPAYKYLLSDYITSAKSRNLQFKLNNQEFYQLVTQPCYYCGELPKKRVFRKGLPEECSALVNGIDRIDSSKDYILENCVPCCTMCNVMKLNYSTDTFLNHISKIYNHNRVKDSETIENTTDKVGNE